ncbi:uncharacterized protein LOC106136303 [Amyelois transitella]|uniref:uncharacterized protein LOC106136303 n=1 Tax=Amyelois transitella TaxID=680683 RepID=UPI00067C49D2|nr:uncharacterized protein LOC106136303 [Amyelois transitella]
MCIVLPRFDKCCFCLRLRTGSLIIGYLSLIISCLSIGTLSFSIYKVATYQHDYHKDPNTTPEDVARATLSLYITLGYYILVFLFLITLSMMLLVGVHTNKPNLLKIYFNAGMFLLGLALALVVMCWVFAGIIATLPLLKWCLIHFYSLLVVRSTYLEMEEENKPPVYQMHNIVYNPHQTEPLIA